MILADSRPVAIRRSLLPVLSAFFYKNFTHPDSSISLDSYMQEAIDMGGVK